MANKNMSDQNKHVYRVDKFIVPEQVRAEFISKVEMTHNMLKKQPGFVQALVLDQIDGPGEFNIVTLVEWENTASIVDAKAKVSAMQQQAGFNPQEIFLQLGIKIDLGYYQDIDFNSLNSI